MSSGLTVSPKSIESYNGISSRKFRVLILRADPNEIVLENSFGPGSGNVEMDWKEVVATLPDDDCRFLVCDFQMQETPTVTKSKIIFVSWSPDTSPIRTKTYVCELHCLFLLAGLDIPTVLSIVFLTPYVFQCVCCAFVVQDLCIFP